MTYDDDEDGSSDWSFPLWVLVHENRYADCRGYRYGSLLTSTMYSGQESIEGVVVFPSPLHAEIYCQQLHALGEHQWRRRRLRDNEVSRILESTTTESLTLLVSLGFAASGVSQLLVDEKNTLVMPMAVLEVMVESQGSGRPVSLSCPMEQAVLLHSLIRNNWLLLDAGDFDQQLHWMDAWCDSMCTDAARLALDEAATISFEDYHKTSGSEVSDIRLAIFEPLKREWRFQKQKLANLH